MITPIYRPSGPTSLSFTDQTGVTSGSVVSSNTITLAGPSGVSDVWPVTVDAAAGSPQISVNGGTWTDSRTPAAVARSGDTVQVRMIVGASLSTRTATIRVGSKSTTWSVTAAAWMPSDLGNLAIWNKAGAGECFTDAGVTVATAGQSVYRWRDKSGNSRHANQTVSGQRPTFQLSGGVYSVQFDGVDDFLTWASAINIGSNGGIYFVQTTTGDGGFAGNAGGAGTFQIRIGQSSLNKLSVYNGTTNPASDTLSASRGLITCNGFEFNGTTAYFYENGTAKGSGSFSGFSGQIIDVLGSVASGILPLAGKLHEVVVLTARPSDADRTALFGYFKTEWGTP